MNRFERIGLTVFFLAILGMLAQYVVKLRFPDDPQMAALTMIRIYMGAILFAVIYQGLPVKQKREDDTDA